MADDDKATAIRIAQQDYERAAAEISDRQKISASIADRALQALLLTNGGALVALFSFVANAGKVALDIGLVKAAFGLFAVGLFLGLLAHVAGFMSQHHFTHQAYQEMWRSQASIGTGELIAPDEGEAADFSTGKKHYFAGILLAIASILLFIGGCGAALLAVQG